jgi:hypothetical protein
MINNQIIYITGEAPKKISDALTWTRFLECTVLPSTRFYFHPSLLNAFLCIQIFESGYFSFPGSNHGTVAFHSLLLVECLRDVRQNVVNRFDANRQTHRTAKALLAQLETSNVLLSHVRTALDFEDHQRSSFAL